MTNNTDFVRIGKNWMTTIGYVVTIWEKGSANNQYGYERVAYTLTTA